VVKRDQEKRIKRRERSSVKTITIKTEETKTRIRKERRERRL